MKKASHWLRKSVVSSAIFAGNRALGFLARGRGGGHLGIFGVGMCRPGLQIGTPF